MCAKVFAAGRICKSVSTCNLWKFSAHLRKVTYSTWEDSLGCCWRVQHFSENCLTSLHGRGWAFGFSIPCKTITVLLFLGLCIINQGKVPWHVGTAGKVWKYSKLALDLKGLISKLSSKGKCRIKIIVSFRAHSSQMVLLNQWRTDWQFHLSTDFEAMIYPTYQKRKAINLFFRHKHWNDIQHTHKKRGGRCLINGQSF